MRTVIPLLALLFVWVSPLSAQDSYSEFERGLNLSDSQKNQVEGIKRKYLDELRSIRRESMRKRLELREVHRNPRNNGGKEESLRNEIRELEQSRDQIYNRYRSEVGRVLNQEQRERYNSFTESERRRGMGPRSFRMGPHGR